MEIIRQLAAELQLQPDQVERTVKLLDEGSTIPFIARYRKEATGELDETVLRKLAERLDYLRSLASRKAEVRRLIEAQERLTTEISKAIEAASTLQELEDIYRPFRPKRKTRASLAKEKGLEPLADLLLAQGQEDPRLLAQRFLNEEVTSTEEALQGAQDILAERFADDPALRAKIRTFTYNTGLIITENSDAEDNPEAQEFHLYFDHCEDAAVRPTILAVNRGERLGFEVRIRSMQHVSSLLAGKSSKTAHPPRRPISRLHRGWLWKLLAPSLEQEIRNALTERAEKQAIAIFAQNLHNLLMQSPLGAGGFRSTRPTAPGVRWWPWTVPSSWSTPPSIPMNLRKGGTKP